MSYLLFLFLHFCACALFFMLVQRPVFCLYNRLLSEVPFTPGHLKDIYRHGVFTDFKVAAYLTLVPLLLLWAYAHFPVFNVTLCLVVYDILVSVLVALLCVADTALYRPWHYKIEASVLVFLRSLKGAFASVTPAYTAIALSAVFLYAALYSACQIPVVWIVNPEVRTVTVASPWGHLFIVLVALLIVAVLFCIIRGLKHRPDNPVVAYYSDNQFFNHCAVNPVYNFIYSLSVNDDSGKQFQEFPEDFCRQRFAPLFPMQGTPRLQLLNTTRPNVVFIIWESLCDSYLQTLGGKRDVMPRFESLTEEGVYFTNCYAGSFRTDRALVCLLSGYLGLPTTTVIENTRKLPNLPGLPRTLRDKAGYETMGVHGGDLRIFHKFDYYKAVGFDTIISQDHFPHTAPSCRWGVHDGYVFPWLAEEITKKSAQTSPWFLMLQTLSSHEPFKVPYEGVKDNEIENSYAYVDDAFGNFIDTLKSNPVWKDLLVVVVGDHGLNLLTADETAKTQHVPLLMLGGAVKEPKKIDILMNQTDIAATLLGQMGLPHDDFTFSRDVLAETYTYPFAFHSYVNGFIFRDATGLTNYDTVSRRAIVGHDEQREETAKVILQTLYADLARR